MKYGAISLSWIQKTAINVVITKMSKIGALS